MTLETAGPVTVTVTDTEASSITGTSDVDQRSQPGPLDHFTVSNPGTQTAGSPFDVTVTALDAYGNAANGWTSTDGCVVFSGAFNSPPPSETSPDYPDGGECSHPTPASSSFDPSGEATASVTLYRATTFHTAPDTTTTCTVTDAGPPTERDGIDRAASP